MTFLTSQRRQREKNHVSQYKPLRQVVVLHWPLQICGLATYDQNLLQPLRLENTDKRSFSYNSTFCSPPQHNGPLMPYKVISIKSHCLQISKLMPNDLLLHPFRTRVLLCIPMLGSMAEEFLHVTSSFTEKKKVLGFVCTMRVYSFN